MKLRGSANEVREDNLMHTGPYVQRDRRKIHLDLNENHYPIPERIKTKIAAALDRLHEYPIGFEAEVIEDVAKFYGIAPGEVAITHGCDEAIDRLIQSFPNMRFSIFEPTFLGYTARLKLNHVPYQAIRLNERFEIPEEAFSRFGDDDFVILANPNNPSGTLMSEAALDRLQNQCGKLLIDEAYIEFSRERSRIDRLNERTFVFRSLSKAFALAGLRLGLLFGAETNIAPIKNRQWFCNMSVVALEAIRAVLGDPYVGDDAARIIQGRQDIQSAAVQLGFGVHEGFGNFTLIRHADSKQLVRFLDSQGISVMDTTVVGLTEYVRISVGNAAENDALIKALHRYASEFGVRSGHTHRAA
jgi:histidinol-phosphate aminotransferase